MTKIRNSNNVPIFHAWALCFLAAFIASERAQAEAPRNLRIVPMKDALKTFVTNESTRLGAIDDSIIEKTSAQYPYSARFGSALSYYRRGLSSTSSEETFQSFQKMIDDLNKNLADLERQQKSYLVFQSMCYRSLLLFFFFSNALLLRSQSIVASPELNQRLHYFEWALAHPYSQQVTDLGMSQDQMRGITQWAGEAIGRSVYNSNYTFLC